MTPLDSTGAAYVAGNFAPLMNEVTAFDLEIIGRIPEALNGRFFRIGPNPVDEPDPIWQRSYHWLAGAGMVHGLRLRDGKADWFRSRFVLDAHTAQVRRVKPILSTVYDRARHRSDVVILEARDFVGEPLATIRLPVRVPFTFHGGWAPDRGAASEQPLI